jgi:hypothetical protein
MPPIELPEACVQLLLLTGSNAGQLMQFQTLTAPSTRQAHVVPG